MNLIKKILSNQYLRAIIITLGIMILILILSAGGSSQIFNYEKF